MYQKIVKFIENIEDTLKVNEKAVLD